MDEIKYDTAFTIITHAGNARSVALMAVESARNGDFAQAQAYLDEAIKSLSDAHDAQKDMIKAEAGGNPVDVNIILIHAQDHLAMAISAKDNAQEFIHLYKLLYSLKRDIG